MPETCDSKKPCVIVLGVTQNHAFAAGCVLQALRRHSPEFGADILVYNDGKLFPKDAEILAESGARPLVYAAPDHAFPAEALKNFSLFTLARFECLRLLRDYEPAIWLDVDIAVQRDISGLRSFGPFALSLEDPLSALPPYPPAKASINVRAPVPDLDGDADNYNAGVLVFQHTLPDPERLYRLCMQWLEQYAPLLNYPDQAVINMLAQYLKRQDPALVAQLPHDVYNAHPKNPAAWDAAIVHGFSVFKFWSNGLVGCCFPEWERDYRAWVRKGGSVWQGPVENARCRERGALPTLQTMMIQVAGMQQDMQKQQADLNAVLLRAEEAEKRLTEASARDAALGEAAAMRRELARERALRQALARALQSGPGKG
jgi:lipopolysaccharide biosynthesis glycosyltransferase